MRIKIIILAMLSCLGLCAQDIMAEFEKDLMESSAGISSIRCDFTQTRSMSVLAEDVVKTGEFTYLRPGNILLLFHNGDYIKITDEWFSVKNGERSTEAKTGSSPVFREIRKIIEACLTGDLVSINKSFDMAVEKVEKGYHVKLTPIKGRGTSRMSSINLNFDMKDMSLSMLEVEDGEGDSLRYDFYNKVID